MTEEMTLNIPIETVAQKGREALKEGKLLGLKCQKCGTYSIALAGYSCRHCGSFDLDWVELSGRAKLMPSASIVYPLGAGFQETSEPYLCGVVELEEGPLMTARIYDVPNVDFKNKPEQLLELIGMKLKMDIRVESLLGMENQYCICFVPA